LHTESVIDLEVKVLGGFISVDRTWEKGKWTNNSRWSRLTITQSVALGTVGTQTDLSSFTLNRNGAKFKYAGNSIFVDETDPTTPSLKQKPATVGKTDRGTGSTTTKKVI
jgi:hypothetical protein